MIHKMKLALLALLSLAVILVVLQNTTLVQAHFLWFTKEISMIALLFFTAAGGFISGMLVAYVLERWRSARS